jgi:hypothetical protein
MRSMHVRLNLMDLCCAWAAASAGLCTSIDGYESRDYSSYAIDWVFMMDSSGSVGESRYDAQVSLLKSLTQKLDVGPRASRISLVHIGTSPQVAWSLSDPVASSKMDLEAGFDSLEWEAVRNVPAILSRLSMLLVTGRAWSNQDRTSHHQGVPAPRN